MLIAHELQRLTEQLLSRSSFKSNTLGFNDRAATSIIERLGIEPTTPVECAQGAELKLRQAQWLDERVSSFFESFSKGQGIEVNSGLSTRFHRLCDLSDWPQFSWQMINCDNVDECLHNVLPELDNFRSVGISNPLSSWVECLGWHNADTVMVIMGEDEALTCEQVSTELHSSLNALHLQCCSHVEFLICHTSCSLDIAHINNLYPMCLVEEFSFPAKISLFKRITDLFDFTEVINCKTISHLKLNFLEGHDQ